MKLVLCSRIWLLSTGDQVATHTHQVEQGKPWLFAKKSAAIYIPDGHLLPFRVGVRHF